MSAIDSEPLSSGSGSDPFPAFSQRRRRGVRVTTAAAVALGLALGGGAIAGATSSSTPSGTSGSSTHTGQPPFGGTPPAAVGTVKSVGSDTFTITSRDNTTVTVNVGTTTTYFDQGVTSPTFANVTVGEHVAVFGTDTSDTVTATKVAIGSPKGGPGRMGAPGGRDVPDGDHDGPPSASSNSSSSWNAR